MTKPCCPRTNEKITGEIPKPDNLTISSSFHSISVSWARKIKKSEGYIWFWNTDANICSDIDNDDDGDDGNDDDVVDGIDDGDDGNDYDDYVGNAADDDDNDDDEGGDIHKKTGGRLVAWLPLTNDTGSQLNMLW